MLQSQKASINHQTGFTHFVVLVQSIPSYQFYLQCDQNQVIANLILQLQNIYHHDITQKRVFFDQQCKIQVNQSKSVTKGAHFYFNLTLRQYQHQIKSLYFKQPIIKAFSVPQKQEQKFNVILALDQSGQKINMLKKKSRQKTDPSQNLQVKVIKNVDNPQKITKQLIVIPQIINQSPRPKETAQNQSTTNKIRSSQHQVVLKQNRNKIIPYNNTEDNSQPLSLDSMNAAAMGSVTFATGGTVSATTNCCQLI